MSLVRTGVLLLAGTAWANSPASAERLYRDGVLPSGRPLQGEREGVVVEGVTAACATCHRRSGLGSWEGQVVIPAIAGSVLFSPASRNVADADLAHQQGTVASREAYTEATLARAIRQGVDPHGRPLNYLMPKYSLDDVTMASLISYLRALTSETSPGVERETLHFATILTPDANPTARQGMLDVLRQFFADKNAGYRGASPPLQSSRGVMFRVTRKWQLHVWELAGPPETWGAQLDARLQATPVFAVLSGLGGSTWAPIHRFCERQHLPCLLPNVDLPVSAEEDFYSVYFSRGVLLEAELMARHLTQRPRQRVVQVFREDDVGREAARALAQAWPGGECVSKPLGRGEASTELQRALTDVTDGDTLVLWLRSEDLARLPSPAPVHDVLVSGLMGHLEDAPLPIAWRDLARLTYPFDLPEQRRVRMSFPLGWFSVRHVPIVDERLQTDTYLACVILSETLGHMLDHFVRDLLVERVEMGLGHRLVNGYYPRLGLAPGQRFASKGGYLVHFAEAGGRHLIADSQWVVP